MRPTLSLTELASAIRLTTGGTLASTIVRVALFVPRIVAPVAELSVIKAVSSSSLIVSERTVIVIDRVFVPGGNVSVPRVAT